MRKSTLIWLICLIFVAVGCGDDGGETETPDAAPADVDAAPGSTFDLSLSLNGYGMQENGNTLYFALYDDADGTAALATDELMIMGGGGGGGGGGGNNAVTFTGALTEGGNYTIYWYSDRDANRMCDNATDQYWQLAIPNVTANVELTHQHTTDQDGDCTKH